MTNEWMDGFSRVGGVNGGRVVRAAPCRPLAKHYGVLSIASRHPRLFAVLVSVMRGIAGH